MKRALFHAVLIAASSVWLGNATTRTPVPETRVPQTPRSPVERALAPDQLLRANAFYFAGDPTLSVAAYEKAIAQRPELMDPWLNGAVVLQELGKNEKARDWLTEAARLAPGDPRVLTEIGWAELRLGNLTQAQARFEKALYHNPTEIYALLGLGKTALAQGRPEAGAKCFQQAIDIDHLIPLAHFWKGKALEASGDLKTSAEAYKQAALLDSYFVESRYALGRVLMKVGKFEEAAAQFAKVHDADPRNKGLTRLRQKIASLLGGKKFALPGSKRPAKELLEPLPPGPGKVPLIRVGIGTTALGRPLPRRIVEFHSNTPFQVLDAVTGKELAAGRAGDRWQVRFGSKKLGRFEIFDARQRRAAIGRNAVRIQPELAEGGTITLYAIPYARGHHWSGIANKHLRGGIEISMHPTLAAFKLVNVLDLESYTHGVLSSEMPIASPIEALKAQSVVARSHALFIKQVTRRHRKHGYDVCDEQHCQVYSGLSAESERSRAVVDATRARVMAYKGTIAHVLYSSNCGGHTQSGEELKGWGHVPYWIGRPDTLEGGAPYPTSPWELRWWMRSRPASFCGASSFVYPSHHRWTRVVPARELEEKLDRNYKMGRLKLIRTLKRSKSGHVNLVEVQGTRRTVRIGHEIAIRSALGIASQRSTLFTLEADPGSDGKIESYIYHGGGWGHAVGMCQSGAMGRAEKGQLYLDILQAYYKDIEIGNLRY